MGTRPQDALSIALAQETDRLLRNLRLWHTCATCLNFDMQKGECKLASGYPVPVHILFNGCVSYNEEMPF